MREIETCEIPELMDVEDGMQLIHRKSAELGDEACALGLLPRSCGTHPSGFEQMSDMTGFSPLNLHLHRYTSPGAVGILQA